jgi:hypothetical protein
MLNLSHYDHYSKDNENQLDANVGGFTHFIFTILFSASNIISEVK